MRMKRASVELGSKHQVLLQDYLELQKEFVSKKKKLQATKQKRDTLLAEVRFLKRKCKYLLKVRSPEIHVANNLNLDRKRKPQIELGNSVNSNRKRKVLERKMTESANEATLRIQCPALVSNNNNLIDEEQEGGKTQEVTKELGIRKNKFCLIDNKAVGKKKISWHDPAT